MANTSVVNNNALKLHEVLMAGMPEGAKHENCALAHVSKPEGGKVTGDQKTYTQAELQAALDEVSEPLLREVARLQTAARDALAEEAKQALVAEYETKISALQDALDDLELAKQAAVDELEAFKAAKEAEEKEAEEKKQMDEKKDKRSEEARLYGFSSEYIDKNIDRWASLTDELWEDKKSDWTAAPPATAAAEIPNKTALTAARETGATRPSRTASTKGLLQDVVLTGRRSGFDPRSIA